MKASQASWVLYLETKSKGGLSTKYMKSTTATTQKRRKYSPSTNCQSRKTQKSAQLRKAPMQKKTWFQTQYLILSCQAVFYVTNVMRMLKLIYEPLPQMNRPISLTTIESTTIIRKRLIMVRTSEAAMAIFLPRYSIRKRIKTRPIVVPTRKAYCMLVMSPIFSQCISPQKVARLFITGTDRYLALSVQGREQTSSLQSPQQSLQTQLFWQKRQVTMKKVDAEIMAIRQMTFMKIFQQFPDRPTLFMSPWQIRGSLTQQLYWSFIRIQLQSQ